MQSGVNAAEANLGLGSAYLAAGRPNEAVARVARSGPSRIRRGPRRTSGWRAPIASTGSSPKRPRKLAAAAPSAESLATLYTNVQVDYHLEEGLVRLAQGRLDAAAAAFEKVLALDGTQRRRAGTSSRRSPSAGSSRPGRRRGRTSDAPALAGAELVVAAAGLILR